MFTSTGTQDSTMPDEEPTDDIIDLQIDKWLSSSTEKQLLFKLQEAIDRRRIASMSRKMTGLIPAIKSITIMIDWENDPSGTFTYVTGYRIEYLSDGGTGKPRTLELARDAEILLENKQDVTELLDALGLKTASKKALKTDALPRIESLYDALYEIEEYFGVPQHADATVTFDNAGLMDRSTG